MITETRLDQIPISRIREIRGNLREKHLTSNPPEIARARDKIAFQKKGMTYIEMVLDHLSTTGQGMCGGAPIVADTGLLHDPSNYIRSPDEYDGIETTRQLIFGDEELAGLQIASNYGPYLFFLRDQFGQKRFLGIDPDPYAAAYAGTIGNAVILGDAAALPVASESQDVVVSYHFMESQYMSMINRAAEFLATSDGLNLELRVSQEIWRVLKPGGWFISDLEIFGIREDQEFWMPFGRRQRFSAEARAVFPELLAQLAAFQKPVL